MSGSDRYPPALAICGFSGSGKTTLLEEIIPRLVGRGLAVTVVKHDAHGVSVDRPGKDSDRLFRAGADVVLRSPQESMLRWHGGSAPDLTEAVRLAAERSDVVLVEGHKATALPKVWLLSEGELEPPRDLEAVLDVLPRIGSRPEAAEQIVLDVLASSWARREIVGGVLVGGRSSRMGRPKQLLQHAGSSIVERVAGALRSVVDEVVLLGDGELPPTMAGMPKLPDPPGLEGPIAGLLAALRWRPEAAWLVASCDLPLIDEVSVRWLIDQRRAGRWAVLPSMEDGRVEPLFAAYEPQSRLLLERLVAGGRRAPRLLAAEPKVACPTPPPDIADRWSGINTPEDYEALRGRDGRGSSK